MADSPSSTNPSALLARRHFLGLAGDVLALPDRAVADTAAFESLDLTRAVEETALRARVAPPSVTSSGWDPDKLMSQAAATMVWAGRARRAAPDELEVGELRDALDERLDGMVRTMWALALELDALDADGVAALERVLLDDPWVFEESRLKFTARALDQGVPSEDVDQVDRAFDRTLWHIRTRGLLAVRDEAVEQLDRQARRSGVDWRVEARRGADLPFVRPRARKTPPNTPQEYYDLSRKQRSAGSVMLGIGILWMAGPQIIFGGICFGPPLIIIGIVKLVAAKRSRKAGEALELRRRE